jgi:UDP:flavonoid glycosyltransferase YjiC (YdhE family)
MLLLPTTFDGPGNTARAVHHGLALRADFQKVSVQELKIAIDKLLNDPSYSESAKRMSKKCMDLQDETPSIRIIESALAGKLSFHQCA